jgi:hypothetical protein
LEPTERFHTSFPVVASNADTTPPAAAAYTTVSFSFVL